MEEVIFYRETLRRLPGINTYLASSDSDPEDPFERLPIGGLPFTKHVLPLWNIHGVLASFALLQLRPETTAPPIPNSHAGDQAFNTCILGRHYSKPQHIA